MYARPEMASERMRFVTRKFELSVQKYVLYVYLGPEMLKTTARALLGRYYGIHLPRSALVRPERRGVPRSASD